MTTGMGSLRWLEAVMSLMREDEVTVMKKWSVIVSSLLPEIKLM